MANDLDGLWINEADRRFKILSRKTAR